MGNSQSLTPVDGVPVGEGVPQPRPPEVSSGFMSWPSPKALVFWLGLFAAVAGVAWPIAGAFFVKAQVYDSDKSAQQAFNARVDQAQAVVTVQLGALQKQVDEGRQEQRQENRDIKTLLNTLVQQRRPR